MCWCFFLKQASGVKVADQVKEIYNAMKLVKTEDNQMERMRLVIFHIDGSCIDVEKIFREKDLEKEDDVYKFVLSQLKADECRYILYDCHFETKESKKEELVFFLWAPDTAPIKLKMNYASSKEALRKILTGIKHEVQLNDKTDCGDRAAFGERLGKNVIKIEGHDIK